MLSGRQLDSDCYWSQIREPPPSCRSAMAGSRPQRRLWKELGQSLAIWTAKGIQYNKVDLNLKPDKRTFCCDIWVFLIFFIECSDKFFARKVIWTWKLLCKRPRCYHRTSRTRAKERIFKLTTNNALVIYKSHWIDWISLPFRENSNKVKSLFCMTILQAI